MPDSPLFWDRIATRYAAKPVKDKQTYERTLDRTRAHLKPEDEVLELGCGTGTTALLLAPNVRQITATDISGNMIAIAKDKARDQDVPNTRFEQADIAGSAANHGPVDVVLAFNLLHLVEDLPGAIRNIARMVKPGGLFISKSTCTAEINPLVRLLIPVMQAFGRAPYVAKLTVDALDGAIADGGFDIIERDRLPPSSPNRFVVARKR